MALTHPHTIDAARTRQIRQLIPRFYYDGRAWSFQQAQTSLTDKRATGETGLDNWFSDAHRLSSNVPQWNVCRTGWDSSLLHGWGEGVTTDAMRNTTHDTKTRTTEDEIETDTAGDQLDQPGGTAPSTRRDAGRPFCFFAGRSERVWTTWEDNLAGGETATRRGGGGWWCGCGCVAAAAAATVLLCNCTTTTHPDGGVVVQLHNSPFRGGLPARWLS